MTFRSIKTLPSFITTMNYNEDFNGHNQREIKLSLFTGCLGILLIFLGLRDSLLISFTKDKVVFTQCLVCVAVTLELFREFISGSLRGALNKRGSINNMVHSCIKGVCVIIASTVLFHALLIIFGAYLLSEVQETLALSCLLSACCVLPLLCRLGPHPHLWLNTLVLHQDAESIGGARLVCGTSLLGCWLGAVPIPLDWDRPWQAWPVTCVAGTVVGWSIGHVTRAAVLYRENAPRKTKWKWF